MNELSILPVEKFGFQPHQSTSDQLLRVVESAAKSNELKQFVGAVFLDVAKAFDMEGLVYKLHLADLLAMVQLIE